MVPMPPSAAAQRSVLIGLRAGIEEQIRRARVNLAAFTEMVGKNEDGDPIELHSIHRAWIVHVNYAWNNGKHAMIMAPFNSGKTSSMLVPLSGFLIGLNPQVRLKIVCANDDMAKLRVASVKKLIDSYEYRRIFPHVQRGQKWDTQDAFVERTGHSTDPTIQARGVLTEGIGSRCDYLLMDDVCTQKNSEKAEQRALIKSRATGTWMSRLDGDGARALAFATAWSSDDYSNDLKNHPDWLTLVQRVQMPGLGAYEQEVYGHQDVLQDYPVGSAT